MVSTKMGSKAEQEGSTASKISQETETLGRVNLMGEENENVNCKMNELNELRRAFHSKILKQEEGRDKELGSRL